MSDIRAAVRMWLEFVEKASIDHMMPGSLRLYHESLPDTLLKMSCDEGVSFRHNLAMQAHAALEHSDYLDIVGGERLRRTEAALQQHLRNYVDRRMQALFGPVPAVDGSAKTVAPPAPQEQPATTSKISTFIKAWQKDIIAGYNHGDGLGHETTDQYLKTVEMFIALIGYGYRRVHVLLEREGWGSNIKRTYRIYRDLGLQLRNKTPKRRVKAKLREDRQKAVGPNDVWAMDFVHDQLATGKKLRVLTVVDTFSRYVPVLDPRHSYRGEDVVQTLERVCRQVGYPKTIRVDQGTEFVSRDLDLWAYAKGVTLDRQAYR